MKAPGADVLGALVHGPGNLGDSANAVFRKMQLDALRVEQGTVLFRERGIGLGEDTHKVVHRQGAELHTDGQAPLQLRYQIRGLGQMKGAGGDEQDVIGTHHAVLGGDRTAFHQGQEIALHTFPRHIGTTVFAALGDLVDLVEKYDAVLLHVVQGATLDVFFIDELGSLFVGQQFQGVLDPHTAAAGARASHVLKHALQLTTHLLHARRRHDLHPHRCDAGFHLDLFFVHLTLTEFLAEYLAGGGLLRRLGRGIETTARPWQQRLQYPLLRSVLGAMADLGHFFFAGHLDGHIHQIADDGVHVSPHIAHLGEFGGLYLHEGRIGQLGQAASDLRLAHAGGPDHEDVLGGDLVAQLFVHLGAPPAVAQGDGHRPLGIALADDMLVQFLNDFSGGHGRHSKDSINSRLFRRNSR